MEPYGFEAAKRSQLGTYGGRVAYLIQRRPLFCWLYAATPPLLVSLLILSGLLIKFSKNYYFYTLILLFCQFFLILSVIFNMSVSSSAGSCPTCLAISITNNPPWALAGPDGISSEELEMIVINNFDKPLSSYCKNAVKDKLTQLIAMTLDSAGIPPDTDKCYAVDFENLRVEVECTCSDKDLDEGKGPPKAEVNLSASNSSVAEIPCPSPPGCNFC